MIGSVGRSTPWGRASALRDLERASEHAEQHVAIRPVEHGAREAHARAGDDAIDQPAVGVPVVTEYDERLVLRRLAAMDVVEVTADQVMVLGRAVAAGQLSIVCNSL